MNAIRRTITRISVSEIDCGFFVLMTNGEPVEMQIEMTRFDSMSKQLSINYPRWGILAKSDDSIEELLRIFREVVAVRWIEYANSNELLSETQKSIKENMLHDLHQVAMICG